MHHDDAYKLLKEKYGDEMGDGYKLISHFSNQDVHFYHLTKIAAKREIVALYEQT
jgi:predicted nucleic acid-binding protein